MKAILFFFFLLAHFMFSNFISPLPPSAESKRAREKKKLKTISKIYECFSEIVAEQTSYSVGFHFQLHNVLWSHSTLIYRIVGKQKLQWLKCFSLYSTSSNLVRGKSSYNYSFELIDFISVDMNMNEQRPWMVEPTMKWKCYFVRWTAKVEIFLSHYFND